MSGLYIHIPFCHKKCFYCDFFSVEKSDHLIQPFINALIKEMHLRANIFKKDNTRIETVYIGGGTPSLLNPDQIALLLHKLTKIFKLDSNTEITIEVNPGTVTSDSLLIYLDAGINRISIGVQSFNNQELQMLGRTHTAKQAEKLIRVAHHKGFKEIGVDLIYGIPDQSLKRWEENLKKAVSLNPTHLSTYELTWNDSTPLGQHLMSGLLNKPDEETIADMYLWASAYLKENGYEHYEISNFAKHGHRCRHNEGYWMCKPYLGLGPSAHSYIGTKRSWNVKNLMKYINVLSHDMDPTVGEEILSKEQNHLEQIALGFRRREGNPIKMLDEKQAEIAPLLKAGLISRQRGFYSLTTRGFLVADEVILQLAS